MVICPQFKTSPNDAAATARSLVFAVRHACLLLVLGGGAGAAHAGLSDTLFPYIGASYTHDDNLLRLPDESTFAGPRADNVREVNYGLRFERPVGRQVFTGDFKMTRVSYDHYSELDYNGKDFRAAWNWQLGNHLEGHVGGQYVQSLTSFSDYHTSERNLRTQRKENADALWRFHPSWRVRAGFTQQKFTYEQFAQRFNDRTEDLGDVGFDYLAASGSYFGLVVRRATGKYLNNRLFNGVPVDESYQQNEVKANIDWRVSGTTRLQVLAGKARRTHNYFTERDSDGFDGRGIMTWTPRGRITLTATLWREFAAIETLYAGSSLNKGGSLAATWELAAKLQLDGRIRRERRTFEPVATLEAPFDYNDSTRTTSLGLSYLPTPTIQGNVSLYREIRTGNAGFISGGNYRSNGVSLSINAQF